MWEQKVNTFSTLVTTRAQITNKTHITALAARQLAAVLVGLVRPSAAGHGSLDRGASVLGYVLFFLLFHRRGNAGK